MASLTAFEDACWKLESPEYTAVIEWAPVAANDAENWTEPLTSVPVCVDIPPEPSISCTVPAGTFGLPEGGVTCTVNVTFVETFAGFGFAVSVTIGVALDATVSRSCGDPEPLKDEPPS